MPRLDAVRGREQLECGLAVDGHDAAEQAPVQSTPVHAAIATLGMHTLVGSPLLISPRKPHDHRYW